MEEYPSIKMWNVKENRNKTGYSSVLFSTEEDLSFLEGTVLWKCQSQVRPHHKRKNWFINVSIIPELEDTEEVLKRDIVFERFHCGGNGGQNVNKVQTGVRLKHLPTGITVTATEERSQEQNRRIAMKKLENLLAERRMEEVRKQRNAAWDEHSKLIRGNPCRVYEGMQFRLKSKKDEEKEQSLWNHSGCFLFWQQK